jgi:hypothetical protein
MVVDQEVQIVFTNLSYGRYGISLYHDENANGKMDKNLMGIPKEADGFSNNAKGFFGKPDFKFDRAAGKYAFDVSLHATVAENGIPLFDRASPILKAALAAAALIIGSTFGSYIGSLASGMSPTVLFEKHSFLQLLILGVVFGSIITYIFSSQKQIAESQNRIQEEK